MTTRLVIVPLILFGLLSGCKDERPQPGVADDQSQLRTANDVFWALQKWEYIAAKEKPSASSHGCKPSEYLAKKGEATFRLSVFECPSAQKAAEIVNHEKSRHVDKLLRNHHEGGILRRNSMEIIVRRTKGSRQDTEALLDLLGSN